MERARSQVAELLGCAPGEILFTSGGGESKDQALKGVFFANRRRGEHIGDHPAQFKALLAYSPVHHVVPGTAYPAVYLAAGLSDPRVDPYHARKMAALLQAVTRSGRPVLLRVSGFGHGLGSPLEERVTQATDRWAFVFGRARVQPPPARGVGAGPR